MKNLSHREAQRRREQRETADCQDMWGVAIARANHRELVRARVIRLLTWSAIATALFTAYAVVASP